MGSKMNRNISSTKGGRQPQTKRLTTQALRKPLRPTALEKGCGNWRDAACSSRVGKVPRYVPGVCNALQPWRNVLSASCDTCQALAQKDRIFIRTSEDRKHCNEMSMRTPTPIMNTAWRMCMRMYRHLYIHIHMNVYIHKPDNTECCFFRPLAKNRILLINGRKHKNK